MISEERKQVYTSGKLLKMTSDKITDVNEMVSKLVLVFVYNAFSSPKDRIDEPGFTKRRCKPAMSAEQISEATTKAEAAIKKIREIESAAKVREKEPAHQEPVDDLSPDTDVLQVFLDAFHTNSAPIDDEVAITVLLSFIGGRELSGDGLHAKVTAETGAGKSYSTNAALHALPQTAFYKGAFSDKALVYDKELKPGMIIKLDEAQSSSDVFKSFVKEAVSSYQNGVEYRTVIEKETIVKHMPPRLTFIVLSADSWGDEQTISRFVPLGLSERNSATSKTITDFRMEKRENGYQKLHDSDAVIKSRKTLEHFVNRRFRARIPNASRLISYATKDQRVQEWFECCMLYHAVLCYKNRNTTVDSDGVIVVDANKEDFDFCCDRISIFRSVERVNYRLTPSEVEIISVLKQFLGQDISRSRLVELSKKSSVRVTQLMRGRHDRDENGLMSKLGISEVNVSSQPIEDYGDANKRVEKRTNELAYHIPLTLPAVSDSVGKNAQIELCVACWNGPINH